MCKRFIGSMGGKGKFLKDKGEGIGEMVIVLVCKVGLIFEKGEREGGVLSGINCRFWERFCLAVGVFE